MGHYKVIDGIRYLLMPEQKTAFVTGNLLPSVGDVFIPDMVEGLSVTGITHYAFKNCVFLETIILPSSIGHIGFEAFNCCEGLTSVQFYKSKCVHNNTKIDVGAFKGCVNLQEVSCIQEPWDFVLAEHAFANCHRLTEFNGHIQNAQFKAFENCFGLDDLVFADDAFWRTNTFTGCKSLEQLNFLGNVSSFLPSTCIKQLKRKQIKCSVNSNIANLAYDGYKVELF